MFVKKKINLDFLWIHTNIPILPSEYRVLLKKKIFCTEDIKIYMRAAHSQLSPSYYFLFAPKGTDNNAYTGVLFIPGAYTRIYKHHKNCGHNNSS